MGVDFAANASSKAIKESVDLSAATSVNAVTYGSNSYVDVSADGKTYTFKYNGTVWNNDRYENGNSPADSYQTYKGNSTQDGILSKMGRDGSVQTLTLQPGTYLIDLYGGAGADNIRLSEDVGGGGPTRGGYGGHSQAIFHARAVTTLYLCIGGKGNGRALWKRPEAPFYGTKGTHSARAANNTTDQKLLGGGGYNGGGNYLPYYPTSNDYSGGGGGGATHIALSLQGDGQLKNYESKKEDVLLVAGGGGGAGWWGETQATSTSPSTSYAGSAGGAIGDNNIVSGGYTTDVAGGGGTQTTGGALIGGPDKGEKGNICRGTVTTGGFGYGGNGFGQTDGGGGGGGGWYGGGGGLINGGGGGSSYYTTDTEYITNAVLQKGSVCKYRGHGRAIIKLLDEAPVQTETPSFTLTRHSTVALDIKGTSATSSLCGKDNESQEITASTVYNGIYVTNDTSAIKTNGTAYLAQSGANSYISYSFSADKKKITDLKALRYWTGEKTFYVRVKDTYTYSGCDEPNGTWFSFKASVEGGELKKDQTL